jgi:hypothetical protein
MRVLTKASTARCTLEHYTAFPLAESQQSAGSACAWPRWPAQRSPMMRPTASSTARRESPRDLFEEVRPLIELSGGTLSVEDTILDKPYAQEGKTELVGYFWSRKHGRAVKGVCLVTLFYSDSQGVRVPVNFRVVDKAEAKTKNELFRAMLVEVLGWGLHPARVSAESWDSGLENLKFLRTQELAFLVGLEKNRILSECEQEYRRVEELELPVAGKVAHLRGFGFVSLFRRLG